MKRFSRLDSGRFVRTVSRSKNTRLKLFYEILEARQLLASNPLGASQNVGIQNASEPAPITWFEQIEDVVRIAPISLSSVDQTLPDGIAGPQAPAAGEWIVQLDKQVASRVRNIHDVDNLVRNPISGSQFRVIAGLGSEGLVLVRGQGLSQALIEAHLDNNPNVASFSLNQMIKGQATEPNDPDYVAGLLPGLTKIEAATAWDESIGSLNTVVGVVDSGIDPAHSDLYLNIWLNQGEIPHRFLDDDGDRLVDIDGDGLITFYDLNNVTRSTEAPYSLIFGGWENGPNVQFVRDLNSNGRIDAADLLLDANWADGRDTDNNGFFDDLFGVNFRAGNGDPFSRNNPSDELGHGTHVAGTIGAIGGNGTGVVGVNWQTSLMSLRILDNNNQGDSGAAIAAINYARMMRERLETDSSNRVIEGANVRVLNNSWGQPGGYEASLEAAIEQLYGAGVLFVAAAGNGNILGQGVDNDRTPFYPASYEVPNVIAVAASDASDRLATFSNFGRTSVDLLAPGVGIRSTVPGGGYQSANGTSMASPHVAGTAALIWAALPESTVDEVKQAILSTTDPVSQPNIVATGGRLNAAAAITADVFAPAARLIAKQDITTTGGTQAEFTIEYSHHSGIDISTLGDDDIIVTRQWGPRDRIPATLKPGSVTETATTATATYIVIAPGGSWEILDYGDYLLETQVGKVSARDSNATIQTRAVGQFNVRITNDPTIPGHDPTVIYVNRFDDALESGTLRSAIASANNAGPAARVIILEAGRYDIEIPGVVDPASPFGHVLEEKGQHNPGGWFTANTGDFFVTGNITIIGDSVNKTAIDAQGLSRVFTVHADANLYLNRLTIQGGTVDSSQGGGAIISIGHLTLDNVLARNNRALALSNETAGYGGAISAMSGTASVYASWLSTNTANFGGGIYFGGDASGSLQRTTVSSNQGGGLESLSTSDLSVLNSTFSSNTGGNGAIANNLFQGFLQANERSEATAVSRDGRYVVFHTAANNISAGDTNNSNDVYVYDRVANVIELVSVNGSGIRANGNSFGADISSDGRFIVYQSSATNLTPDDTNNVDDIFIYDRELRITTRLDVGSPLASFNFNVSISGNGNFIVFPSRRNDLAIDDTNSGTDLFVFDRSSGTYEVVNRTTEGTQVAGYSPVMTHDVSDDGRFVVFAHSSSSLVPGDNNGQTDIFIRDRTERTTELISVSSTGLQGNGPSRYPAVSADGRYVSFESTSTNLFSNDENLKSDVFRRDRLMQVTDLVSVNLSGQTGRNFSIYPSISADGHLVSFTSAASDLIENDANGMTDIFVRDMTEGKTRLASVAHDGGQSNQGSTLPEISADGSTVIFQSDATNLVLGDENQAADVFVNDLRLNNIDSPVIQKPISTLTLSHVTVADTVSNLEHAVTADAIVINSLFSRNQVTTDLHSRSAIAASNNVFTDAQSADLIGPLSTFETFPPVRPLRIGNPAINAATIGPTPNLDQLGNDRGAEPDIGAVEAVDATLAGVLFVDYNGNGVQDDTEAGLSGKTLVARNAASNTNVVSSDENGSYIFSRVPEGAFTLELLIDPKEWSVVVPQIQKVRAGTLETNNLSVGASLSGDGRFVGFGSNATNLVPSDSNNQRDVFAFDRQSGLNALISQHSNGTLANSFSRSISFSQDGRYAVFSSNASNLVENDTNNVIDVFVRDLVENTTERVSIHSNGNEGNNNSDQPSISRDGRYVAFSSTASNLVNVDNNGSGDVFVHDRLTKTTSRVSVRTDGGQGNGTSDSPAISADGRFIAFTSFATNLVDQSYFLSGAFVHDRLEGKTELVSQFGSSGYPAISGDGKHVAFSAGFGRIYHFDRSTQTLELVSVSPSGQNGNGTGGATVSISDDGRFLAFSSNASNLVNQDANSQIDVFVRDLVKDQTVLVSVNTDQIQGNADSLSPKISADGRFIAFESLASNLVDQDSNGTRDIFYTFNPLADPRIIPRVLKAGEVDESFNIGLAPRPGQISGRVFEDVILNDVFDTGEPQFAGLVVFLDTNGNGSLDPGERSVFTAQDGTYEFLDLDSYQDYSVVVRVPSGFEVVYPVATDGSAHRIFLPAGGEVTGRDFALRPIQSAGQSSRSEVAGQLFVDKNNNGVFDAGIDEPIANTEIFLDAANFGVRDEDEPRGLTDEQGRYSFDGLSARNVAVTTVLDQTLVHVNPLGSKFNLGTYPLFGAVTPFANPQAIAANDFNDDGSLDVAVALGEANKLSIRLNDGKGGFLPEGIDIDLGANGAGPTSLVAGQFDSDPRLDVALTANFSGYVTVLRNFDPVSKNFASIDYVKVGAEPLDIAAGNFNGDNHVDLVVVNKANNTVQVLTNDGNGVFAAGPGIPTGGRNSSSIVVGNFTGDSSLDVAVIHASPLTNANPFGGVTVLSGDGMGGLTLGADYYTVGATPIDAVVADFNGDDRPDIAVSNFGTNSISILLGQADGTFRVQEAILGTASGAFDITVGDVDNDGDIDIFASNLRDRNISIFRNNGPDPDTGDVRFQPLENIGLGQFALAQRMPIVVGNFDNDTSGPGGSGTIDIVTIPQRTDTLHVLTNTLVNGSHRVALTGLNTVSGLDFIIKPAVLPPSFAPIPNPTPILEDASSQAITINNIIKGRTTGPELQFTVTSDNPLLIASPGQLPFSGGTSTSFTYTPLPNSNGTAVLTVEAIDAGADQLFGNEDDGIFIRSFTVTVLPVNDPPAFNVPPEVTRTQKAGPQSIPGFVTEIGPGGGADESNQNLTAFTVSADPSFFVTPPTIDASGQLSFEPSPNKSGVVPVSVSVSDNGGRTSGGVDTTIRSFVINILPVNDSPSISLAGDLSVRADADLQTVPNFATDFHPGGGDDEASQVISDFVVSVDSPGLFSVLPNIATNGTLTYAPAIDRVGTTTVSVHVRDSGGRANGGNDLSEVKTFTITVTPVPDTTRPTPVIRPLVPSLTNLASFEVEVVFSEPVTGFEIDDVLVTAGSLSAFEDLSDGKFKLTYSGSDGNVTFSIAEGSSTDLAGNLSFAADAVVRTIDTVGVTGSIDSLIGNPNNAANFSATILFGEPVVGFTLADLTVLNGTATNLVTVDAAAGNYSVTITPTNDGNVTVLLPAGLVTDLAGNVNSAVTPLIRTSDRTRPTVSLSTNEPELTNRTTFDVFAQFNEPVTGLTAAGLNVTGGTAGAPQLMSPGLYRFTITATAGPVRVRVVENAAVDLAGNASHLSNELTVTVDPGVAISPILTSTSSEILNILTFPVDIDFSTQVTGFTLADIAVVNGTATNLTVVDLESGKYRFNISAGIDAGTEGFVNVLIPAGVLTDLAGNLNSASNILTRIIDRVAPQPKFLLDVPSLTNQANFLLTVDFGETITDFALEDVVISGASLSELQSLGSGRFTMNVAASHGTVTFQLPAGSASDVAGNTSKAAGPLTLTVDTSIPSPTLTTTIPLLSNIVPFSASVTFGERILGFQLTDLVLINGTASNLVEIDQSSGSYTFDVAPVGTGATSVFVPAGAASDLAGNLSQASNLLSRTIDRVAPHPVLTTSEPSRTNKTSFVVFVNFGETVSGLTKEDFQVTGATLADPINLGDGRYSVAVSGASGLVELKVPAGVVQDAAGNSNTASDTLSITVDTAALVPLISAGGADLLSTNRFNVSAVFGKQVSGFEASKVTVLGASITSFAETDSASGSYTFSVQAPNDGIVTVLIPAGVVQDLAGNENAGSNVLTLTIDRTKPTPELSVPFGETTNRPVFDVTVNFDESVNGLELTDFVSSGLELSNLRITETGSYLITATVTNETISLILPANTVQDLAGNANLSSNLLSRTVDLTSPLPVLSSNAAELSNASTFDVQIDFPEPVIGMGMDKLLVFGGTLSNLRQNSSDSTTYTVTISPNPDGTVTVFLPSNSVTDLSGNGNTAALPLVRSIDLRRSLR